MFNKKVEETCPMRHPKTILGTCALCRKQVCEDCLGLKSKEKLVCKFCFQELQEREAPKVAPGLFARMGEFLGGAGRSRAAARPENCAVGVHVEETTGACTICKKGICPACTSEKKLSGKPVCATCFASLFQIRDQLKIEEQARFVGGLKGAASFSFFSAKMTLIALFIATGLLAATLELFYVLYPASFTKFNEDRIAGQYWEIVSRDVPALCYEIYERTWYEWWYDLGMRMPYERWKQEQEEDAAGTPPAPANGKN